MAGTPAGRRAGRGRPSLGAADSCLCPCLAGNLVGWLRRQPLLSPQRRGKSPPHFPLCPGSFCGGAWAPRERCKVWGCEGGVCPGGAQLEPRPPPPTHRGLGQIWHGAQLGTPGGGTPHGRRGVGGEGGSPGLGSSPGQASAWPLVGWEAGARDPERLTRFRGRVVWGRGSSLGREGAPGGPCKVGGPLPCPGQAKRSVLASGKWFLRSGWRVCSCVRGSPEPGVRPAATPPVPGTATEPAPALQAGPRLGGSRCTLGQPPSLTVCEGSGGLSAARVR